MLHSSVVSSSGIVTGGGEGGVEGEGSGLRGVLAAVWVLWEALAMPQPI